MIDVTMTTPMSEVDEYLNEVFEKLMQAVRDAFIDAAKDAVDDVRANGEYQDQSGSLRSSTGAAVGYNGEMVWISDFNLVLGGVEGVAKGRELARSLVERYSKDGISVALVAGEDYAVYVEAIHNRNVLATGEALLLEILEQEVPKKVEAIKV